jgi:hypothetical protein
VDTERLLDLVARFGPGPGEVVSADWVCRTALAALGADGAVLSVHAPHNDGHTGGTVIAAAGPSAPHMDDVQFDLGEGPLLDARHRGGPLLEPDIANAAGRWPVFAGLARRAGVAAVFVFPLLVGTVDLGALCIYRDRPGDLEPELFPDALVLADLATEIVLSLGDDSDEDGGRGGLLPDQLRHAGDRRAVVHQAVGAVASQLGVSTAEALVRLRAFAFAHDRHVDEVAVDVVDHGLRIG